MMARRTTLLLASWVICGCGDSPSSPTPPSAATITVSATGVTPREVTIPVGGRVTFHNTDVRQHAVSSDPVQTHTDCPAINEVGTLGPGDSRATETLTTPRVCGFHDHQNENDAAFKGRIIIQ